MLDEQLDNPIIPEISTDLLRLISKIDRIYSVIERSSDIIYYSFNDLVRASINKCLARIDYFYLEKRIDLYKVIKSVSHDYTREEAMQGMYPNLIISSYVRNSNILEKYSYSFILGLSKQQKKTFEHQLVHKSLAV